VKNLITEDFDADRDFGLILKRKEVEASSNRSSFDVKETNYPFFFFNKRRYI